MRNYIICFYFAISFLILGCSPSTDPMFGYSFAKTYAETEFDECYFHEPRQRNICHKFNTEIDGQSLEVNATFSEKFSPISFIFIFPETERCDRYAETVEQYNRLYGTGKSYGPDRNTSKANEWQTADIKSYVLCATKAKEENELSASEQKTAALLVEDSYSSCRKLYTGAKAAKCHTDNIRRFKENSTTGSGWPVTDSHVVIGYTKTTGLE